MSSGAVTVGILSDVAHREDEEAFNEYPDGENVVGPSPVHMLVGR